MRTGIIGKLLKGFGEFTRHPLICVIFSGVIAVSVGGKLTSNWEKQNLFTQVRLELYKDEIRQRHEFVEDFSRDIWGRLYALNVYFENVKDNARKTTILDSWDKYRTETIKWNSDLRRNIIRMDQHFPASQIKPASFIGQNDCWKNSADMSFRSIFEEIVQKQFTKTHSKLIATKIKIVNEQTIPDEQIAAIKDDIKQLYVLSCGLTEALAKARNNYNTIIKDGSLNEDISAFLKSQ